MPFETYEESLEQSQPVELYEFTYNGGTYRYTSAAEDIGYDSKTFTAYAGLSRSAITDAGEISKSSLTITAPSAIEVARLFEVAPPSDVLQLVVYRLQRADLTDAKILWLGRVLNVSWQTGYATLTCESLYTSLRTPGLRRQYSRNCPHVLYGAECGASQTGYQEVIALDAAPSTDFEVVSSGFAVFADNYFTGGKLIWEPGGGIVERRGIRRHTGDTLVLSHPIPGIAADSTVTVWPGCDRTTTTCFSKFSNLDNYGGFPYIPQKNPFGQSSVF